MLVLARREAESLRIGDDTKIIVLNIGENQIKLGVNDSEGVNIDLQESVSISDDIKIKVVKINITQVKLGIEAPANRKVDRV